MGHGSFDRHVRASELAFHDGIVAPRNFCARNTLAEISLGIDHLPADANRLARMRQSRCSLARIPLGCDLIYGDLLGDSD